MKQASIEFLTTNVSMLLGETAGTIKIILRKTFEGSGTYPAEVITCLTGDNRTLTLFCKYFIPLPGTRPDHRSGMAYEANFYNTVLMKTPLTKIIYYGHTLPSDTGESMMVLEYLGDDLRMDFSSDPHILSKAAEWIARFHSLDLSAHHAHLRQYDSQYFMYWLQRFEQLSAVLRQGHPYIPDIVDYFATHIQSLLSYKPCVIHGEFYPKNILVKEGVVYPVDWESAAVGPAEIDLACLIEGWENEMAERAKDIYFSSRGLEGSDRVDAEKRLFLAQLYLFFRWWPEQLKNLSASAQNRLIIDLNVLKQKVYLEAVSN